MKQTTVIISGHSHGLGAALTAAISPAGLPGPEEGRRVAESVVNGLMRSR